MLGRRRFRWPENDLCWPRLTCFLAIPLGHIFWAPELRLVPGKCSHGQNSLFFGPGGINFADLQSSQRQKTAIGGQLSLGYFLANKESFLSPESLFWRPEVQLGPKLIKCWARND